MGRMYFVERVIHELGINMHKAGEWGTNYLVNPAGYILLSHESVEKRGVLRKKAVYESGQKDKIPPGKMVDFLITMAEDEGFVDDRSCIYPGIRRCVIPVYLSGGKLIGAVVLGMLDQLVDDKRVQVNVVVARGLLSEILNK